MDSDDLFKDFPETRELELKRDTSDWAVTVCFVAVLAFLAFVLWLIFG